MRLLSRTRALRMLLLLLSIALPAGARQTQPAAVVVHRPTDTAPAQPLQSKRIMPYHRQRDKRLTGYLLAGNCAVFVLLSRSPHAFAFLAKNDAKIKLSALMRWPPRSSTTRATLQTMSASLLRSQFLRASGRRLTARPRKGTQILSSPKTTIAKDRRCEKRP